MKQNAIFLNSENGFTLIELMFVFCIMSVLAAIAIANFFSLKTKAYDAVALTDARNLVSSIIDVTLNDTNVNFAAQDGNGGIGVADTGGIARSAIFTLSNGVVAVITGNTNWGGSNDTYFFARVYNIQGSSDGGTLSGKKEFVCEVDEAADVINLP